MVRSLRVVGAVKNGDALVIYRTQPEIPSVRASPTVAATCSKPLAHTMSLVGRPTAQHSWPLTSRCWACGHSPTDARLIVTTAAHGSISPWLQLAASPLVRAEKRHPASGSDLTRVRPSDSGTVPLLFAARHSFHWRHLIILLAIIRQHRAVLLEPVLPAQTPHQSTPRSPCTRITHSTVHIHLPFRIRPKEFRRQKLEVCPTIRL